MARGVTEPDVDARRARLEVPGMVQSSGEPIKNPVTGAEHRVRIDFPESFEFRLAEIGSGTSRTTGAIELDLSRTSRERGDAAPRLCGQLWMIRRFTSAQLFPQSAGPKQKNHSGSSHYGICRVALRRFNRNGFFAESVKSQAISD
jgi:hypothetical protein